MALNGFFCKRKVFETLNFVSHTKGIDVIFIKPKSDTLSKRCRLNSYEENKVYFTLKTIWVGLTNFNAITKKVIVIRK